MSTNCCVCMEICAHSGPHTYCDKHKASDYYGTATPRGCPSCVALRARIAEDSKRLNQSMDTIHAVSENRRKMFEDAHNALTRIYEKLDREKVRVVIKHDAWAITSHDDPFILYQQGNMSKGKLCEYIASAIISYLKEAP